MSKSIARNSFILHLDSLVILDEMTNEQAGIFLKSIKQYQITKKLPELDFGLKMAITPFINQFIRDEENYKKTCEARRLAGGKGGKQKVANASKSKQKVANLADSDSKSDSDSDSKNKNDNKNKNEKPNKPKLEKTQSVIEKEQFELFWNRYDKKVSRADVEKRFMTALKKDTIENIMSGLDNYLKTRSPDSQYWKNPATWLNQECWKDEYVPKQDFNSQKPKTSFGSQLNKF